jgi:hypothetical protein
VYPVKPVPRDTTRGCREMNIMLRRGDIKGRQVCPGAPWVIKAADLASFGGNSKPSRPLTPNGAQRAFDFQ